AVTWVILARQSCDAATPCAGRTTGLAVSIPSTSHRDMMTSRLCRRAVLCVLVTTATGPLDAQAPSQFAAAAGAGGSALGWQPQVAVRGVLASPSLGPFQTSVHGSLTRFAMPIASPYELTGGARLLIAQAQSGWWLGGDVVQ